MNTKKWTLALATAAVAALTLAACSNSNAPSSDAPSGEPGAISGEGRELVVLMQANNNYPEEQRQWQEDKVAQFAELTGAELTFEMFTSANEELQRIQTSVVSGSGPDVYTLGTTFTPTAFSTGAFTTLGDDEWDLVGGRDRFNPAALGISGPSESEEVGIPFVSRPFVLAYNTAMFEAAGIDAPSDSWDGLVEQAQTLTSGDVYGMAVAYADGFDPWKFIWAMAAQAGNPLVDGSTARIDDPTVAAAYEEYFSWIGGEGVVNPEAVGWTNAQALSDFAAGGSAIFPMTTANSYVTLSQSPIADDFAYAVMPTIPPGETVAPADGAPATSILSGDNLVVADYSDNKDLAFAFIELVTSTEEQLAYQATFGDLPTNAEALSQIDNPLFGPLTESAAASVATPFTGAWSDIQLALTNVVVQSVPDLVQGVDATTLEQRLQEAQNASQDSLDRVPGN